MKVPKIREREEGRGNRFSRFSMEDFYGGNPVWREVKYRLYREKGSRKETCFELLKRWENGHSCCCYIPLFSIA